MISTSSVCLSLYLSSSLSLSLSFALSLSPSLSTHCSCLARFKVLEQQGRLDQRNFAISLPNEHMHWTGLSSAASLSAYSSTFLPQLPFFYPPPSSLHSPYFHIFSGKITCKFQSPCCMYCPLAASVTSEHRPSEHCLYPALVKQAVCGWHMHSATACGLRQLRTSLAKICGRKIRSTQCK